MGNQDYWLHDPHTFMHGHRNYVEPVTTKITPIFVSALFIQVMGLYTPKFRYNVRLLRSLDLGILYSDLRPYTRCDIQWKLRHSTFYLYSMPVRSLLESALIFSPARSAL